MTFLARLLLIVAGALVGLFLAEDALSFPIWQGVIAILLLVAAVLAMVLYRRR